MRCTSRHAERSAHVRAPCLLRRPPEPPPARRSLPLCPCSITASMTAGNPGKFNRRSRNACTATSLAAFSMHRMQPAGARRRLRQREAGEACSVSGARKSSRPALSRSRNSTPASMRSGHASAWAIGVRMSGAAQLRQHRAVHVLDQRVHDALRVHEDLDLRGRHAEQQARLDQLQPLVHQGRRIDRDLAAHVPVRMRTGPPGVALASASARQCRGRVRRRRSAAAAQPGGATPVRVPGGRHWKIALCSLSIGSSVAPERAPPRSAAVRPSPRIPCSPAAGACRHAPPRASSADPPRRRSPP